MIWISCILRVTRNDGRGNYMFTFHQYNLARNWKKKPRNYMKSELAVNRALIQ